MGTHAFVRKNLVAPVNTSKLLFYVKRPMMQIRGVADFIERKTGDRHELLREFGTESCFESFNEYCAFIGEREKVTVVRFENFRELETAISADAFSALVGLPLAPRGR